MQFVVDHSYLIPLLPLLGAAVAGFFGARYLKGLSHWPIWIGVGAAAVLSIVLLFGMVGATGHEHHPAEGAAEGASARDEAGETGQSVNQAKTFFTWFQAGDPAKAGTKEFFKVNAGFWFDPLTAVMLGVVCGIGFLITVFAAGYMKGEEGYFRFFAYLGLFIFMMTVLVMGENLVMLYLGWEGVGLCSYLLIGYYYDRPAAREAAKKAFLVNRIGDFGFGLGIMLCFLAFGTVSYFGAGPGGTDGLLEQATNYARFSPFQRTAMDWIPFLLMLGAFGKSAQFPLHVWLPDAMEGPTPVSALIHAATMVTAGVYMIVRCGTLFVPSEAALATVACVGAFTALMAATIALRQFDLKKVFAYSTISQLGFMFVGVGVLAPVAGVFHLVTHAFFKALLFLSSGVVMHAMLGHLDMRKMSGLKHVLPKTRWLMLVGCLALAGVPPFAGFFSKDEIVASAWHASAPLGLTMLFVAFLTAYYTFRLYFRVFEGPLVQPTEPAEGHHAHDDDAHHDHGHAPGHGHDHHDHGHHDHEPALMILPLVVLALGAVFSGILLFWNHSLGHFLGNSQSFHDTYATAVKYFGERASEIVSPLQFGQPDTRAKDVIEHEKYTHYLFMIVSTVIASAGIGLAWLLHLRDRSLAERVAARVPRLVRLLEAKYWVDEIYDAAIVEPLRRLGRLLFAFDQYVVDGIVSLFGWVPWVSGLALKVGVQRGSLQGYASAMAFGIVVILVILFM
jgi:NADH-quinone oxidoreductase subunit L